MTETDEVCRNCGYVNQNVEQVLEWDQPTSALNHSHTPIAPEFRHSQRYVDGKYVKLGVKRARRVIDLLTKELGVHHSALNNGTMLLYTHRSNRKLARGLNHAITVTACMYVTAQKMHITITLSQLADILIKHDLIPARARSHPGLRRYIRALIYRLANRCMRNNNIEPSLDDVHPVAVLISQVGAQYKYDPSLIRSAIEVVNTLLRHDVNVFAGRKPAGDAATILYVYANGSFPYGKTGAVTKNGLARDFKISTQQIRQNLIRIDGLFIKYDIRRAPLP